MPPDVDRRGYLREVDSDAGVWAIAPAEIASGWAVEVETGGVGVVALIDEKRGRSDCLLKTF
jgi:hypothetical protein